VTRSPTTSSYLAVYPDVAAARVDPQASSSSWSGERKRLLPRSALQGSSAALLGMALWPGTSCQFFASFQTIRGLI
jgi:hypothetical protein